MGDLEELALCVCRPSFIRASRSQPGRAADSGAACLAGQCPRTAQRDRAGHDSGRNGRRNQARTHYFVTASPNSAHLFPVWHASCMSNRQMLPSSHAVPIKKPGADLRPARSCLRMHFRNSSPLRRCWSRRIAICSKKSRICSRTRRAQCRAHQQSGRERPHARRSAADDRFDALRRAGLNHAEPIVMINPEGRRLSRRRNLDRYPPRSFRQPAVSTSKPWQGPDNQLDSEVCVQA